MKIRDILRLIGHETKYGRREWVLSFVMQTLLMSCVLVSMAFFVKLLDTGNVLLHAAFGQEEFSFQLSGYTQADLAELEDMGFEIKLLKILEF